MKKIWHKAIHIIFVLFLLGSLVHYSGLRVNITNSLPIGLYRLTGTSPERNDLVTFSLPEDHPYVAFINSRDNPPSLPVRQYLKRLIAVPGDDIQIIGRNIQINGQIMPNSAFHDSDRIGRPLLHLLISGTVPLGKALVLSTYNPMSFDGRYFGLLDLDSLQKVVPVLTFN